LEVARISVVWLTGEPEGSFFFMVWGGLGGIIRGSTCGRRLLLVDEGAAGEVVGEGVGWGDGEFDVDAGDAEGEGTRNRV
jgi:hypothetical protein